MYSEFFTHISSAFSGYFNHLTPTARIILPAASMIFLLLCYIVSKLTTPKLNHDFNAIAGDDLIATQLDLARAYIEIGDKYLAKNMLKKIRPKGNVRYKQQIKQLIAGL